jgi:Putative peptidoglycan binding domain
LVLASQKYQHFNASSIGIKWADQFGQALKQHGFDVVVVTNPSDAQARASLREFARKAEKADFALIAVSGHLVTYSGQSFYLPTNVRIRRATDLLSRALSLASIAQIGSQAKQAAMLVFLTVPEIPADVPGIGNRPAMSSKESDNIITVFSSSTRVPVSRVDRVSAQAARNTAQAARQEQLLLPDLVDNASAGGLGLVLGKVSELNLDAPPKVGKSEDDLKEKFRREKERYEAELQKIRQRFKQEEQRRREEEKLRRRLEQEREQQRRDAEEQEKQRRAAVEREKQRRAADEKEKLQREEESKNTTKAAPPTEDIGSLQLVERMLGWDQRREIQRKLKNLGLYRGPIDAIFGPLTRQAIRDFQAQLGATQTGYLKPKQFERLLAAR